jgi:hypothetical protein
VVVDGIILSYAREWRLLPTPLSTAETLDFAFAGVEEKYFFGVAASETSKTEPETLTQSEA